MAPGAAGDAVADRDDARVLQVDAVEAEVPDVEPVEDQAAPEPVVAAVLRQVDEDAARRGRVASAPEADERQVAAEEVLASAQVEQRARRAVAAELEHGAGTAVLVGGGRNALDAAHAVRHGEPADEEAPFRDADGLPGRRRGVQRGLHGRRVVGRAVADGAECRDVDHGCRKSYDTPPPEVNRKK